MSSGRERILGVSGTALLVGLVAACAPESFRAPSSTPEPIVEPTKTPTPSFTPTRTPLPTPSLTATVTLTEVFLPNSTTELLLSDSDLRTRMAIEQSRGGDTIFLENVLIEYVVKLVRPGFPDAVFGILAVEENGEAKGIALVENFDCEFERMAEAGDLGEPVDLPGLVASGVWRPEVRINTLTGVVFVEYATGTIPVITSQSFVYEANSEAVSCLKESIFEGFGELPREASRGAGVLIRDLIEGFEEGFFE